MTTRLHLILLHLLFVVVLPASAAASSFELSVTYFSPQVLGNGVGFGLPVDEESGDPLLPASVTSRFRIDGAAFLRPLNNDGYRIVGLADITGASVSFGDGESHHVERFYLQLRPAPGGGPFDFVDLTYGFAPIATDTTAWGIVTNNSFQMTIRGTTRSNDHFEYHYLDSTQSLRPVAEGGPGLNLLATLALLAGWRRRRIRAAPSPSGEV